MQHEGTMKQVADVAAVSATAGAIMQWLPPIAAGLSIVWVLIRIYEYVRWVRSGRPGAKLE